MRRTIVRCEKGHLRNAAAAPACPVCVPHLRREEELADESRAELRELMSEEPLGIVSPEEAARLYVKRLISQASKDLRTQEEEMA
jgi:hypothetical protein